MKKMLLSSNQYEIKMALLENNKVMELFIDRKNNEDLTGNFYKGRIIAILNAMNIIFLDIGLDKKAFLSAKIKDKNYYIGQDLLVQIKNNFRDEKGIEVSLDYSIPSKNLVLLPKSKKIFYSNKINSDVESIKKIFKNLKSKGLIIRSSALNLSSEKLLEEYEELEKIWENIKEIEKKVSSSKLVYKLNNPLEKIITDYIDKQIDEIIIDNTEIYENLKKKNLGIRLSKHLKDEDLFQHYRVDMAINQALSKKVYLASGAYIIIEKTEALISIDVNTGQNVGDKNLETTIYETNLEASAEIARQLRLRNLSGIIIIDFIDMKNFENRKKVLENLEEHLKKDRLQTKIISFSNLGLVEMTRKRNGKELSSHFNEICPLCEGSGKILSDEAIILNILKDIREISNDTDINRIEINLKKDLIDLIKKEYLIYIENFLKSKKKKIDFVEDKNLGNKYYNLSLYKC